MRIASASAAILILMIASAFIAGHSGPIEPIETGYGGNGDYKIDTVTFKNPAKPSKLVYLFHPRNAMDRVPVIFFAHGFGAMDPGVYQSLINHIVSRGIAVVYPAYPATGSHKSRYEIIFSGFEEAVSRYGDIIDSSKSGFFGHSYGAGALPWLARRGIVDKGWGGKGAFIFSSAPWYSFEITNAQLAGFPRSVRLIMQVYEEDTVNDHRMAVDIFETIAIPRKNKEYFVVFSDQSDSLNYRLSADHLTPAGAEGITGLGFVEDALDYYALWRPLDALCDCVFNSSKKGRRIALGGGKKQSYMGRWPAPENRNVKRMRITDKPDPLQSQSYYLWKWDSVVNPRR